MATHESWACASRGSTCVTSVHGRCQSAASFQKSNQWACGPRLCARRRVGPRAATSRAGDRLRTHRVEQRLGVRAGQGVCPGGRQRRRLRRRRAVAVHQVLQLLRQCCHLQQQLRVRLRGDAAEDKGRRHAESGRHAAVHGGSARTGRRTRGVGLCGGLCGGVSEDFPVVLNHWFRMAWMALRPDLDVGILLEASSRISFSSLVICSTRVASRRRVGVPSVPAADHSRLTHHHPSSTACVPVRWLALPSRRMFRGL